MVATEFIAAIELSSSKISGIAGRRNADGSMQLLAYATEASGMFVRKGSVYNIGKAAQGIMSIIHKLEEQLKNSIAKVYVGIGGQSLRTVKNVITRAEQEIISQELVDSLCDENRTYPIVNMDILDVVPQEYVIDNHQYSDPVGVTGQTITGQFLNIVANASLKKNLELSFEQAKVNIAELLTSPLCLAHAVLNDNEMRSGCALVDMGADTTTVMVYKNNILRYLCVLPLGGNSITRDIATLRMEEEEAEKLKLRYADALYEEEVGEGEAPATCTTEDGRSIELSKLNEIVQARLEEILANVWNQIQLSGYEDKLLAGVVFTGGTANIKHLEEAFGRFSKMQKVRTAQTVQTTLRGSGEVLRNDGTQYTLVGLLLAGRDNCCLREMPKPGTSNDMFRHDEDLKAQEEAKRMEKAEAEKQRKKEEEQKKKDEKKEKEKKPSFWKRFTKVENFADDFFGESDKM